MDQQRDATTPTDGSAGDGDAWLALRLLGAFDARRRGVPLPPPRSQKERWLLALLALRAGREIDREWLAGELWPDSAPEKAAYNLRRTLSDLRTSLGADDRRIESPTGYTVRLDPDGVFVDLHRFDDLLQRRDHPAALEEAVALYTGHFLEGCDLESDWVIGERERRRGQYRDALERLADHALGAGDLGRAETHLREILALDPLRESAVSRLMNVLHSGHDYSTATREYRDLRVRLSTLNMEPSPELTELYRRIQAEAAKEWARPPQGRPPTVAPNGTDGDDAARGGAPEGTPGPPDDPATPLSSEPPSGALPVGFPYYVARATDDGFLNALRRRDSIVLLKGPRQFGKTSLLARGMEFAKQAGYRVVKTDLQKLNGAQLASSDALLRALAARIAEDLNVDPERVKRYGWSEDSGPNDNFERFLRRCVLLPGEPHLVWALDEADRLFEYPYRSEVFGLMRSWHNDRSHDPEGPWSRLTLAITYATEAHLFITDLNQSPFNVGTRLALDSFAPGQMDELNRLHEAPLKDASERERFARLVGGHPFLTQAGLWALRAGTATLADLEDPRQRLGAGPYEGHLRSLRRDLQMNPRLHAALLPVLRSGDTKELTLDDFYRLRAAGVLSGDAPAGARLRCGLYEKFLRAFLEETPPPPLPPPGR